MLQSKDDSQDKVGNKIDRNFNRKQKKIPLMEQEFKDLVSLKDQLKWIELKRKQKQNK